MDEIRKRHVRMEDREGVYCLRCCDLACNASTWPCDTARVLEAHDRLRGLLERARHQIPDAYGRQLCREIDSALSEGKER